MRLNQSGTTFIEILIATFIFVVAVSALLSSLTSIGSVIDSAKERNAVTGNIRDMMEDIQATPFSQMMTQFPNATVNGPVINPYQNITGAYLLNNEAIAVTYTNISTDPLEIIVTTTWEDKQGHALSASMATFKTR